MYKVSVLVPIYGVEKYIVRCAESLFGQTYQNLEFVFVDDVTPDRSIQLLEEVLGRFPNRKDQVTILHHERNRGVAAARNTALDHATGEFIFAVDSDDWVELDAIQSLVDRQLETDADIVYGWVWQETKEGRSTCFTPTYQNKKELFNDHFAPSCCHTIWGKVIRRSLYEDYHIRSKEGVNMCDDWWQIFPLVHYANKVNSLEKYVYCYNMLNESSYCFDFRLKSNIDKWKQALQSVTFVTSFFKDKEPVLREASRGFAIIYIRSYLRNAAKYREKQFYKELRDLIRNDYRDCYNRIRFNNPIIRMVHFNYFLLSRSIRPASFVYSKIKKSR